jgi:hypothetical protein
MSRPLIVTDCDEVLLHMIAPFSEWLGEAHAIDFDLVGNEFHKAMTRRADGSRVERRRSGPAQRFFDTEMHRQYPIAGAVEASPGSASMPTSWSSPTCSITPGAAPGAAADNGIAARVFTNQGPEGTSAQGDHRRICPVARLLIDDLAQHHGSAAETVPHVARLHLCGEPKIAPHIDCAHAPATPMPGSTPGRPPCPGCSSGCTRTRDDRRRDRRQTSRVGSGPSRAAAPVAAYVPWWSPVVWPMSPASCRWWPGG